MAQCMQPIQLKRETNINLVPCGKCPNCKARRVSAWSYRLIEEERVSLSSFFITLTYDTKHVPITQKGYMTLDKKHMQDFMKRLRKRNKNQLKYYLCGEYGGKTNRPHYHIILFNVDVKTIQPAWDMGQVHYGQVSEASVGYTLKYISKTQKIPLHQNDDRIKEFSLMSKGLGKSYIRETIIKWHKEDLLNRMYCNLKDGKKITMPRYYRDKLYTKDEKGELKSFYTEKYTNELIDLAYNPKVNEIMRNLKQANQVKWEKMKTTEKQRGN